MSAHKPSEEARLAKFSVWRKHILFGVSYAKPISGLAPAPEQTGAKSSAGTGTGRPGRRRSTIRQLVEALQAAKKHLEYTGYGDSWERSCAKELPKKIDDALEAAKNFN